MEAIERVNGMCLLCTSKHETQIIRKHEHSSFKGVPIDYDITTEYCNICDECSETEEMFNANDIAAKNAYREKVGLLTTSEIALIRDKYDITQSDLSLILGWEKTTITRYEGHQVQSVAHDSILRRIAIEPEWFLELLGKAQDKFSPEVFQKYKNKATELFAINRDNYLRRYVSHC